MSHANSLGILTAEIRNSGDLDFGRRARFKDLEKEDALGDMVVNFQAEHNLQTVVLYLNKSEIIAHNSLSVSHSVHDELAHPLG